MTFPQCSSSNGQTLPCQCCKDFVLGGRLISLQCDGGGFGKGSLWPAACRDRSPRTSSKKLQTPLSSNWSFRCQRVGFWPMNSLRIFDLDVPRGKIAE